MLHPSDRGLVAQVCVRHGPAPIPIAAQGLKVVAAIHENLTNPWQAHDTVPERWSKLRQRWLSPHRENPDPIGV